MKLVTCVISVVFLISAIVWMVLQGGTLHETRFSLVVKGPVEGLTCFSGALRRKSFETRVVLVCRSEGLCEMLSDEEIKAAIRPTEVRYDSKSEATFKFSVKTHDKDRSRQIARAYLKAVEGALAERNSALGRGGVDQIRCRAVKLQRKLMKRGYDTELENALSNAVAQVRAAEEIVAERRIEIIKIEFLEDANNDR